MKIGYARVSTEEQSEDPQLDALNVAGCERIFRERMSGKSKQRPELERLDRLGRSLKDLIELLDGFKSQQVKFISLNESIDTTTAVGELAFHMIGSIAQFERRLISERTKAGLDAARARGRKGGRRAKLTTSDIKKAQAMLLDPTVTKSEVAEHFGVSRPTLNKSLSTVPPPQDRSLFEK